MKKITKICLSFLLLIAVASVFCSCGAGKIAEDISKSVNSTYDGAGATGSFKNQIAETADESDGNSAKAVKSTESVSQNRKIIKYINLSVETKTFEKLIADINTAVEQSGGYIENSQIGGNSYYGNENRNAELKIRIPKSKESSFSDFVFKNSNVVNKSVNTDDVTDSYIDTESRIKALKIEKETLEKLLKESKNVSDTLTVYEKLTDVIAEIESSQGRLNKMDNLIDYTTFTVNITEVEKETKVEKQSWFTKTFNGLLDNLSDLGNGLLDLLSFIISSLPYWILIGLIVIIVICIVRRKKKKTMSRKQAKADDEIVKF